MRAVEVMTLTRLDAPRAARVAHRGGGAAGIGERRS
jgi:hypothetical protein